MENKADKTGFFRDLLDDFKAFGSMCRDFAGRKYPEKPWWTIIGIMVALIYIVNPFDIVPDAIPLVGAIDDGAVAALELALIRKDLHKYRRWRESNKEG
jgi:uncharacterized membrane protein YkvA (DUF1232 family)